MSPLRGKGEKALEEAGDVCVIEISHEKNLAVLEAGPDVTDEALKKAVTDAGYEVKGIR